MAFTEVQTLDAENTTAIGGVNRKTGKKNPASAEGYYIGTRQVDSKKSKSGKASIHFLQTPKGNLGIWGKTDLDRKLSSVPVGAMVRVSFTGMTPTPNGDMYKYKVEVDGSNTIPVSTSSLGADTDDSQEAVSSSEEQDEYEETEETAGGFEEEDSAQSAALAALERKNKVQALLNGKGRSPRN